MKKKKKNYYWEYVNVKRDIYIVCVDVTTSVEYFRTFKRANEKAHYLEQFSNARYPKADTAQSR